jgi:hypothetical protein
MNAYGSKLCSAVVEEFLLAVLAAVGFVDYDFNSHPLRGRDYTLNEFPSRRFEQRRIADARHRVKAPIL